MSDKIEEFDNEAPEDAPETVTDNDAELAFADEDAEASKALDDNGEVLPPPPGAGSDAPEYSSTPSTVLVAAIVAVVVIAVAAFFGMRVMAQKATTAKLNVAADFIQALATQDVQGVKNATTDAEKVMGGPLPTDSTPLKIEFKREVKGSTLKLSANNETVEFKMDSKNKNIVVASAGGDSINITVEKKNGAWKVSKYELAQGAATSGAPQGNGSAPSTATTTP